MVIAGALSFGVAVAQAQSLTVSNVASAAPGSQVQISVTLSSNGAQVAGTQNTLTFDNTKVTLNLNAKGKPDCTVNPAIDKGGTSFALQPPGCSGSACNAVKALVLALDNTDAIPDGSVLYTCNVNVAATASGTSVVAISGLGMSDPNGGAISGVVGESGAVVISPMPPTATPRRTPSGPALIVDIVNASPGQQVAPLGVTLFSGGAQVAGTANTLTFDNTNVTLNLNAKGKPDCTVNPAIDKGGTSFALQPPGCSGSACNAVKALVLALDNTDAIVDGSVLYTCNVNIAATASGTSTVTVSGLGMSDPNGGAISGVVGENGAVVIGGPTPTTAEATATPTTGQPTPRPTPPGPALIVDIVNASPGQQVAPLGVTLFSGGAQVAGTANTLTFDNTNVTLNLNAKGKPDCTVNPAIDKGGTSFALQPPGCSGSACNAVKALVLALDNTDAIVDGSVLYTCNVNIAATASGTSVVAISGLGMSDPNGGAISGVVGESGAVVIGGPTPKPTTTAIHTWTPPFTATPTQTRLPTSTPTPTPTWTLMPRSAVLGIGDAVLFPAGERAAIPILLTNDVIVSTMSFTLTNVPNEISLSTEQPCAVDTSPSSRVTRLTCNASSFGGKIGVVLMGSGGIAPGKGQIATLYVDDAPPECSPGHETKLQLDPTTTTIVPQVGTALTVTTQDGWLHCACRGDANGDGATNAVDLSTCIDCSIGRNNPPSWQCTVSHMTCGDAPVSFVDCLAIADVILWSLPACPQDCTAVVPGTATATVTFPSTQARSGTDVIVEVGLDNQADVLGIQVALSPSVPSALTLKNAQAIGRAATLSPQFQQQTNGTMNVGLISLLGTQTIPAGSGSVLALDLGIAPMAAGDIALNPDNVQVVGQPENQQPTTLKVSPLSPGHIVVQLAATPTLLAPTQTPMPVPPKSGGGGGCRLTPGSSEPSAAWLLVAAAVLHRLRRRLAPRPVLHRS